MANALLSTVNAARQRQPMCMECEKSLPNQIVFDKIESIIRLMQDEQNGLPVKTAKSFMSKIPSVFTGIDLIQWMMKNLKLEDQQEALHLANLIASHGYIFPIEDHTLSIKNDCTFYRFQTPCLWPSNNSEPENTDYAVYLCKRTMQGKTRLELADYEAENLARLQKMFSRKWEFIFMQAESQAKVDKKRDKLERKVLDSQERAFWDVYRPVPGCVNTTELDIKKACRLSKSAKRCSECQKVAAVAQGLPLPQQLSAPSPEMNMPSVTFLQRSVDSTPVVKTVQILEDPLDGPRPSSRLEAADILEAAESHGDGAEVLKAKEPTDVVDLDKEEQPNIAQAEQPDDSPEPAKSESAPEKSSSCSKSTSSQPPGAHQAHHHHHHHHHHPHQHGHHHHHHHHRQCPHHKHHQHAPAASISSDQSAGEQQAADSTAEAVSSRRLSEESSMDKLSEKVEPVDSARLPTPKKKQSTGEEFIRAPSLLATHSGSCPRRKSECNRVYSMAEGSSQQPTTPPITTDNSSQLTVAKPTACCSSSSTSLDHSPSALDRPMNQRSVSNQSNLQQQQQIHLNQQQQPGNNSNTSSRQERGARKSSLNIFRSTEERPASAGLTLSGRDGLTRKSSIQGQHPASHQHSQLKSTQSVSTAMGSTSASSELLITDHLVGQDKQNIGDLERELEALKVRLDRRIGGVKMSKVTQSYLSYFKQWAEYDPFVVLPIPSNPWISDSTELWDSERQTKDVHCRRVRRWAFSLKELLNDPAGREQFHRFLEKEFSAENLKFWDAVQELKRVHSRDVARRVEAIWTEYLAQDANCPINIDSKSYETSKRNMAKNKNNRYIFDEAAGHVYQLMKNDSYPRYLRSDMYKDYKEASEKKRSNQVAFDVFKPQITTLKHKFNF